MENAELYYHVAHSHLLDQNERNRQLEFKARGTLVLAVTLTGVAAITVRDWSVWSSIPVTVFALAFFYTVWFALQKALKVRDWWRNPDLNDLTDYLKKGPEAAKLTQWVGDAYSMVVDHNEKLLTGKAKATMKAMTGLVVQVIALGATLGTIFVEQFIS